MIREEAIEILQGAIKKPNTKDGYLRQAIDMAIKALEQESRKGHWIHGHCGKDDYIRCDKCGKEIVQNIVTLEGDIAEEVFNFCPYCGCRIEEVE